MWSKFFGIIFATGLVTIGEIYGLKEWQDKIPCFTYQLRERVDHVNILTPMGCTNAICHSPQLSKWGVLHGGEGSILVMSSWKSL